MIGIVCYIIGIFITPIILKKFFNLPTDEELDPLDTNTVVAVISMWWPISLIVWLMFKILLIIIWIYNKI